jgi:zinc transporter
MSCTALLVGDGPVRAVTAQEAAAYSGPGFVWIHVESDNEAERSALLGPDIPDVAANALVATETRPRCDARRRPNSRKATGSSRSGCG